MKSMRAVGVLLVLPMLFLNCSDSDNPTTSRPTATEISGSLSGVLPRSNSPYLVTGTVTVQPNTKLEIAGGVRLMFADSTMLIVKGELQAVGSADRVIEFEAAENNWFGVKFIDTDAPSQLSFCTLTDVLFDIPDSLRNSVIEVLNADLTMQNCIIRDNFTLLGGGLFASRSQVTVSNNIFRDNRSENFGAGILLVESEVLVINNTIFRNECINFGGGLVVSDPVSSDIQNNIFYQNTATGGDPRIALFSGDSSNFTPQYNFLPLGNMDPLFFSSDNLHLAPTSPAIDKGNPDAAFNDVDLSRNDQGAYGGPLGNW